MSYYLRGSDGEVSGLGALGAVPAPVYEICTPFDAPCVKRNLILGDAWEAAKLAADNAQHLDWCLNSSQYDPKACRATYGPGGSIDATANAGQPVQGYVPQTAAYVQGPPAAPAVAPAATPGYSAVSAPAVPAGSAAANPALSAQAAGTQQVLVQSTAGNSATVGGFDLSTIPWWGWLAAGGAALLMMKGGR